MQRLLGLLTAVAAVAQVATSTAASAPPEQIHIAFAGVVALVVEHGPGVRMDGPITGMMPVQ
jgi:hypothetical protein